MNLCTSAFADCERAIIVTSLERQVHNVADNSNGFGSGTLVLSFITGLAAGVAAVLLYTAKDQSQEHQEHQEEHLFI